MIKKAIKIFLIVVIVFLVAIFNFYNKSIKTPVAKEGEVVLFSVSPGDGVKKISADLADKGLIGSRLFFNIYITRSGLEKNIQAGIYELSPTMSAEKIVKILSAGEAVSNERSVKAIEGWSNRDLAVYFEKEGLFPREEFMALVKDKKRFEEDFYFLQEIPVAYDMEGYLFPDTYNIFSDATADDVVYKMLSNFDKKVTLEMRQEVERKEKTLYEVITLASIIEKEVRSQEDMEIVSGIFHNRLEIGQPLQSCATLAYVLGENKARYTIEDTQVDSPYNTYQNSGLPPGPIANPGLRAIKAAIYPAETDYNFFLSASDTGETVFSRTLEEHNLNKAKYLK